MQRNLDEHHPPPLNQIQISPYLEPLVLEHALDGSILAARRELRLEYNTEGSIPNNLAVGVLDFPGFTGQSILYLLADNLCSQKEKDI